MKSTKHAALIGGEKWLDENGNYHREDGPAFISDKGSWEWFLNGRRHRINGPAVYLSNWEDKDSQGQNIYPEVKESKGYFWFINKVDITEEVIIWMKENNVPDWPDWDDEIKTLFKLRFA